MKIKKVNIAMGITTCILGLCFLKNNQSVQAAVVENSVNSQAYSKVSENDIQSIDPYVEVIHNQYVLSKNGNEKLSQNQIIKAEKTIKKANEFVNSHNLIIDPETKDAIVYSPFISFAAYNKHYTYAWKWFGGRYYFTSNAAVRELAQRFRSHANNLSYGSAAVSFLGPAATIVSAVGSIGATRYNQMASDLEYYNAQHSHNQIYMDLNWNGSYSFHILK